MTIDEAGKWLATIKHPFAGEVTNKLRELEADLLRAIHDSEVAHEYASMVIAERARLVEAFKIAQWFLDEKECRSDLYYSLKGDSEEVLEEFNRYDEAWIKACADIEPEEKT